jgi:hypothetical protein
VVRRLEEGLRWDDAVDDFFLAELDLEADLAEALLPAPALDLILEARDLLFDAVAFFAVKEVFDGE